ncbi:capsular polysaccharide biosynthesis protein [Clostridium saccharoperbutylacetonicum]|uniref:Capsular polysaccharide biosynthesis protein CpsC n=1 Tax=Clostridium saccharoperbutylacetonicum N1-4(HMT) TaxID=931276 RepID=M1MTS3_9CLOT|nr:Wzz/FepE/Etk N-terminal domain-containing protein [Clostridium saccharoperbutylacetonicum]AGF54952.1 capsular polysaccharide biosynthesis protein CpsC [Clostridium saccharoperbutylacetonicum N1-4(HMT)]NRT64343.1 capsular polysaccharide biosynthesis protein [Clostridium saccharoperbutylacetonicum]NSB27712.1 capsular polysaccharide biosynthesis protein [Clostridium saccharoperbutylacetonicum]NSB41199.1 capsular polysaccharide biosynthesis protein [Clostridium saccharoperbutylacetonicum]
MNEEYIKNEEIIKFEDIFDILIKRWKMILLITLSIALIAVGINFFLVAPKYKASEKVFIGKEDTKDQSYNTNDVQMYQKLIKTYAELMMTDDLVDRAIKSDGLNITSEKVLSSLTVTPRTDTQIIEIQYISTDKALAKDVVNSITNEFIKSSKELIPNGKVKVIESAKVPESPSSPNKAMNIFIASLVGFIISIGLAFLLEFIDNTFKTKGQLEEALGIPVIGVIPDDVE